MDFLGFQLRNNLFVAPMAGVTDRPFRQLCKSLGAGLAVSEMVTSNSLLYGSAKTRRRADHEGEVDPVSVQIAGAEPAMVAQAARYHAHNGARSIATASKGSARIESSSPKVPSNIQWLSAKRRTSMVFAAGSTNQAWATPSLP